ncbi:site-specific DNA-methyltransferase [Xanthomonas sp. NCPPB 1068]|uniref:site-specific DNA-methyltransferase n=1 Tax=Xanthomonas sp. NCPPB 1068 TaxID=487525 RepID=UPI003556A02E
MGTKKTQTPGKSIEQITHTEAKRKNIPTVEHQSVMQHHEQAPVKVKYPRGNNGMDDEKAQRNRDLDPQLVWRGKDQQDWSDLVVNAPPLYIQEKVKPKVLIDDLRRVSEAAASQTSALDLFGDFNGLPEGADRTEFYQHEGHWQNRMILGDSLQVMASLAEREGLRGKVQCIYFDPPYGIKFNSNFQWSTADRSNSNDAPDKVTREPEQVKAFRDTWRNGIHSYLTYLRDRLNVARDLLTDTGSIFVQIGDENLHRVRAIMDEVFGDENFISIITFKKTHYLESDNVSNISDYLVLFAKDIKKNKHKKSFRPASLFEVDYSKYTKAFTPSGVQKIPKKWREDPSLFAEGWRPFRSDITLTQDGDSGNSQVIWSVCGSAYLPGQGRHWRTHELGRNRLYKAGRVNPSVSRPFYIEGFDDSPSTASSNIWTESLAGAQGKIYVVQTNERVLERCILMASDPGDLVLDPTCGSGTTAYVAEQWGRRWITVDTSRVALALARARIMGARYPFYLLADSPEGQLKEAQITRSTPSSKPTFGNIAHGFVYERVPHIALKSIANNAEIDVIWDKFQTVLEPLRDQLNNALKKNWQEWEIPRELDAKWNDAAKKLHADWWEQRIARQKEIDASIAAKAEFEFLYDKPYEDKKRVRVAGPFTVESLSPHRVLGVDEEDNLIDHVADTQAEYGQDFVSLILANLRTAGVQQAHKVDKIEFTSLEPWPGELVCAEGHYLESGQVKRAGILVGPEFGTVTRVDLVDAAREAGDANFDVLIACAFNFDAPASEFSKLGRINVLKARMNADLHMAEDLKNTGKGNLFVIFGEPDVDVLDTQGHSIRRYDGKRDVIEVPADGQLVVRINGVDVFHPSTGEVRSDGADGIACWFLDTDYNEESFFVRHAYFLGANDPYKALKTTLKAEIDPDAWATLNCDTSRPFPKPSNGRFAVKVINHLGDEVMKVFKVS